MADLTQDQAERAADGGNYGPPYDKFYDCGCPKCASVEAENAALKAENERLRTALEIIGEVDTPSDGGLGQLERMSNGTWSDTFDNAKRIARTALNPEEEHL